MGCSAIRLLQMAIVLSLLMASITNASTADNGVSDDNSATDTLTVTVRKTSTTTITRTAASTSPTPTSDEMTVGVKEYRLQGCFEDAAAGGGAGTVAVKTMGLVLGEDYIVPKAEDATGASSGGNSMSLSLCLQLCAASTTAAGGTYPFVGLSGGDSCYCGTTLGANAHQATASNCALPCHGNATETCGGMNAMAVYKLMASSNTHSNKSAAQGKFAGADPFSSDKHKNATDGGRGSRAGVTAGIAVGSISGCGLLMLLVFLGARYYSRRRGDRRATTNSVDTTSSIDTASTATTTTTTTTATATTLDGYDKPIVSDARRISLRRLDGVVMDHDSSTAAAAATTGAEWRNGGASPLTPRTPRHANVDLGVNALVMKAGGTRENDMRESGGDTTPSIIIYPPDHIAPGRGLGERAWHRRRLSVLFPPPGSAVEEGEERNDDRRWLPSQSTPRDGTGNARVPALSEDDSGTTGSPSWRWTLSTEEEEEAKAPFR